MFFETDEQRMEGFIKLSHIGGSRADYVQGGGDFLIMADVSGSMIGRPMASSVGLAIYFAERNTGAYHNLFMTFSEKPQIVDLKGSNIFEKPEKPDTIRSHTGYAEQFKGSGIQNPA